MLNRQHSSRRAASGILALLLLVAATPALAQRVVQDPDPRWQAWLGCWAPVDMPRIVGGSVQSHAVCVVPTASASAVDIATIENGKVVSRQRMEADGAQHANTKDGCTGWESAQWSAGKRRVFVRSEYTCPGGLARSASGLFTINGEGIWLDIEGVSAGGNKGVRALRYSALGETAGLPDEIVEALRGRATAVSGARVAASASLTIADIVEASHRLAANVVEAWLVEFNAGAEMKPGALSAKQLTMLADDGVPSSTIDVIVALAYPQVFALNPATNAGEFRVAEGEQRSGARSLATLPIIGYDAYGFPMYGSGRFMSDCSSFGYSSYYSSSYGGCSPYCYGYYSLSSIGCSRYGYGYGYGAGYGWYPGGQQIVIIVKGSGSDIPAEAHGRVAKGHGYTQGSSSSGTSTPRESSSGSSSTGSSSSGSSSAGSSSSGSSSSGRTAVPKKP